MFGRLNEHPGVFGGCRVGVWGVGGGGRGGGVGKGEHGKKTSLNI